MNLFIECFDDEMILTPSPISFLPFPQKYLEAPIPESSWPCKPFGCQCPYEKKITKKSVLPPLSAHFKISVQKPTMDERIKQEQKI